MESGTFLHSFLIILGLIIFFIAIKPGAKLLRYKNVFWILGNAFFIAAFVFKYISVSEISYTLIAMLLFTNLMMVTQGKPIEKKR